jgi:hypothetical protein
MSALFYSTSATLASSSTSWTTTRYWTMAYQVLVQLYCVCCFIDKGLNSTVRSTMFVGMWTYNDGTRVLVRYQVPGYQ